MSKDGTAASVTSNAGAGHATGAAKGTGPDSTGDTQLRGRASRGETSSLANSAASQLAPTAIHAPTPAATTVNSTPITTQLPTPTPFAQAQPDIANILAQLRGRTDGTYQLRAQVHPAELGAVAITATVHHGGLSVVLSPDQSAQQAISQSLTQLRQHLADQGFTGVNVGLGSPNHSDHGGRDGGDGESRAQGSDHSSSHGQDTPIGAIDASAAHTHRIAGLASALDRLL